MSISEILDHVRLNSSVVTNGMPNATMLGDDASHYTDVEADNHSLDAQELPAPTYISSLKMTSAIERVFATPELLEAILIQLIPTNQLLRAQLISRLFHTTITTSPKIQQLLFFRPNPTRLTKDWFINPLLRQHFLPWFAPSEGRFGSRNYDTLKLMDWTTSPSTRDAFLHPEASWRNMLLTQPQSTELKVVRWIHGQGGDSEHVALVSFPAKAVTMGRVYDIAESFLREESASFPCFGVGFDQGKTGLEVTLYLRMTSQCSPRYKPMEVTLNSAAAEMLQGLEWKSTNGNRRRLKMDWSTELSEERGGVGEEEWEEWKKMREGRVGKK
jgi:hypothetical protein